MDIKQELTNRFLEPLKEGYSRRIIFWQDPDKEFEETVDSLEIENVNIIKLNGSNNFAVKYLLSVKDTTGNYLIYNPVAYADISDNWLLDIELYSEEFRADMLSLRMQKFNIPDTLQMRKFMKDYSKFFDNKERTAKFSAFNSNYSNPDRFQIDILAVLAGTNDNSFNGILRMLLKSGFEVKNNSVLNNIKKFGNENVLWSYVDRYTGYTYGDEDSLINLASHILLTSFSVLVKDSLMIGFEKYISKKNPQFCYSFTSDWMHSDDDDTIYDIAREVESYHNIPKFISGLDIKDYVNIECFPCINECIIKHYMSEISDSVIKASDIIDTVEKRRTLKWFKRVRFYYDGLLQVAQMQQFYHSHIEGFHIADYKTMWGEYCDDYYKMDYYYRLFFTAFNKSLKLSSTGMEDLYKTTAEYVEKLYKNIYLKSLNSQWTNLIREDLAFDFELNGLAHQSEFYSRFVKPITDNDNRVYVIISDALRYEVGVELNEELIRETKGTSKVVSMMSVFPSATKYGMAALLPHKNLALTENMQVLCDGKPTDGTVNRDKILKLKNENNAAVTYKDFISMKQTERRECVSKAKVVYIYHNAIDAVGDKAMTEDQVFNACEDAIVEIKNLVRIITNDLSGSNILITADHGFLYSYSSLNESDKVYLSDKSDGFYETDHRYIIADENYNDKLLIKTPLTLYGSNLYGFTPYECIRIKKQGGGINYVHGGLSLQETVVPVIEFKNIRAGSKKYVDTHKTEIQLINQSRKISNSIFSLDFYQKDAVLGKTLPATYEVYMADVMGNAVSDRKIIIADKSNMDDTQRITRTRFNLKNIDFNKTEKYYLIIRDAETANIIEKTDFTIDIAFSNDFDF